MLAAAIDRELTVSGSARSDDIVTFTSETRIEVSLGKIRLQTIERWANYPLGVLRQFQERGFAVRGFDARITGDRAAGVGLSSSAALEVATTGFLMKLHHLQVAPFEVAKLCQRAENEFVGVPSGPLDQITSIFGRADHLVYLDCQSDEVRTIPFPSNFALVIADSGVKHSLVQGEYKARRVRRLKSSANGRGWPDCDEPASERPNNSIDPIAWRRERSSPSSIFTGMLSPGWSTHSSNPPTLRCFGETGHTFTRSPRNRTGTARTIALSLALWLRKTSQGKSDSTSVMSIAQETYPAGCVESMCNIPAGGAIEHIGALHFFTKGLRTLSCGKAEKSRSADHSSLTPW